MKLNFFNIVLLLLFSLLVTNCSSTNKKSVHGDKPLIDPAQIVDDSLSGVKRITVGSQPRVKGLKVKTLGPTDRKIIRSTPLDP